MTKYKYLFLDRDGVINVERSNDYVKNQSEFEFEEHALKAFELLKNQFDSIYIVTNQRGVGRNIMNTEDLENIHKYMLNNIRSVGCNIDKIYYCTDSKSNSINRKPNIGMAFQAKRDFPQIDFALSIMVGNSRSDIEFGKKTGMYTVLVGNKYPFEDKVYKIADKYYSNLYDFALSLLKN